MADLLTYARSGPVATITMDDGKANVLSPAMLGELNRALDQAVADNAIVLLTGREQRFSAGFDLNVFKQGGVAAEEMLLTGLALSERLLSFPTPVVAACTCCSLPTFASAWPARSRSARTKSRSA